MPSGSSEGRRPLLRRLARWLAPPLAAAVAVPLTAYTVCDFLFACGCTWPWAGAARHCNIHNPFPPHCPVCADALTGALFTASLFAAWWAVAVGVRGMADRLPLGLSRRR